MTLERIRLWDLPTRLFHWSLVVLVAAAVITGKVGGNAIEWHGRIGQAVVGLLTFRIVWGFAGTASARFLTFLPAPAGLRAYLRGEWRGAGHNPLGALSVLALLGVLAVQTVSGLFANDDIAFNGPLYALIDKATSDWASGVHRRSVNLLLTLVALHVGAVLFYVHARKDNLLRPMLDGWKSVPPDAAADLRRRRRGGGLAALLCALSIAAGAVYGASGAWIAPPPAPASAPATPDW